MKQIKVLGSGCSKCIKTADIIAKVAADIGVEVNVIKETDPEAIMNHGVMSTPAVVIDDTVVHSGSIPSQDAIRSWLA
ncbi:Thiol-disulfide isomerase [Marinobacterium lacunae]|uniref:Thiol-disulfide isomerase n=1 Tax=Marinobacterium lacunae TaxID=1232683 RepID=A0A081FWK3_9GAMM|nr:thioredoxin family protein [Marinobacterium lacunae]KEA62908.1 Thiol-disulfide isomerase [Marinobacterium lacunae]MBR9882970.1 thioredoxin family protein [Oceanospirillales bacterium]